MRPFLRQFASRTPFRPATITKPRLFTMTTSNSTSSQPSPPPPEKASPSTSESTTELSSQPKKKMLALPEAPYDPSTTTLDMSSGNASVKLDHLGPMVVNVDGTLSRISNWEKMADIERKNTLRIIGKRNQERLDVLKAKEAEKANDGGS